MTQDILRQRELVSALADGQLRDQALAHALDVIEGSEEARASWQAYHLIGDVLRSPDLAASHDADFAARLRHRLDEEMAPAHSAPDAAGQRGGLLASNVPAANGRWKMLASLAAFAVLAVGGWQVVTGLRGAPTEPQLALGEAPAAMLPVQQANTLEVQQRMLRDPRLDQLLAAHQQFGGTSAWQMPAGFLRNATYERPAR